MKKQRNPKTLKKQTFSFVHKGCLNCIQKNQCISCSLLNQAPRRVLLRILGYRQKLTKEMIAGTQKHKEFFEDKKELDEYGIKNFFKDLYSGKQVEIKETSFCSPVYGLRGYIDLLTVKYSDGTYNFEITELKPKYNKNYIFQLAGYVAILSDILCKIVHKKKIKKEHLIARRLYPNRPIIINIKAKFIYYKTGKQYTSEWVSENDIKEVVNCLYSKLKKIRIMMKAGINYLSELPKCNYCGAFPCDFKDICDRYTYSRSIQNFFGKTKLLVKNKPIR